MTHFGDKKRQDKDAARGAVPRMPLRPNAFATDIRRTITGNLKRFISLFIITALGATMLVGLKAACDDLRMTADDYYDAQHLFDISVKSTLGLDEGDIEVLSKLEGIDAAEGSFAETAYTDIDGASEKVDLKALSAKGLNEPQVVEGRLPRDTFELAVTQKYLDDSGKKIGDTVTFAGADEEPADDAVAESDDKSAADAGDATGADDSSDDLTDGIDDLDAVDFDMDSEQSEAIFVRGEYTIVGVVLDPMDVNAGSKTMSFRSTGGPKYAFFLTLNAVENRDTFTVAYLTVNGASDLMTYSSAYKDLINDVKQGVEDIREQREEARTDGVKADAHDAIDGVQGEVDERFADAQSQIDDALAQIAAGKNQLSSQGASAEAQLDAAQQQIDASRAQVDSAMSMADTLASVMGDAWPASAWQRLKNGDASAKPEFVNAVDAYLDEMSEQADEGIALCDELNAALEDLPAADPDTKVRINQMLDQMVLLGTITADQAQSIKTLVALYPESEEEIEGIQADVAQLKATIGLMKSQLSGFKGQAGLLADAALSGPMLDEAQAELDRQRADAQRQLNEGVAQLVDGEREAAEGQAELDEQKADANAKFADAHADVDGIDRATWYIQDRTSLASYSSIESDASSIESIATVFPLIFFTVAVLISLTTVTRMVEEDRGLIGVYKALGYSKAWILSKYLIYSFSACLAGGIAGDVLGFIVLPEIIFTIFTVMYALPEFQLGFNLWSALAGVGLFAVGIVGATFLACRHVLKETPASLMRPKAPRAGKRILLEHITPLWRRMSFLNKVSARNLFRYKKRFLMTVFGIAGCTALMICGLGIRDTVISLKPRQYGADGMVRYDLMAVTTDDDFAAGEEVLRETGEIDTMLEARVDTATAEFGGVKESLQLIVVPNNADFSAYMRTVDGSNTSWLFPADTSGEDLPLSHDGNGVLVTKNVEQVLGFGLDDEFELQDSTLRTGSARVDGITVNFLGNFVIMTEDAYREAFGEACVPNAFLVNLTGTDEEKIALADELASGDEFVSVSSSTRIANDFSQSFKIIDVVVYIVTVMAAALAFAVVFTLSNTNISERERELATIKVLGFRRREVYRYINKETIVLTLIGIVAGWPMGYAITRFLTYVLRMPSLFFDTIVEPQTYLFASVMSLVFTLIINQMTNRSLDRIDMVGALKSAE